LLTGHSWREGEAVDTAFRPKELLGQHPQIYKAAIDVCLGSRCTNEVVEARAALVGRTEPGR
jgi:hypothetical protein